MLNWRANVCWCSNLGWTISSILNTLSSFISALILIRAFFCVASLEMTSFSTDNAEMESLRKTASFLRYWQQSTVSTNVDWNMTSLLSSAALSGISGKQLEIQEWTSATENVPSTRISLNMWLERSALWARRCKDRGLILKLEHWHTLPWPPLLDGIMYALSIPIWPSIIRIFKFSRLEVSTQL